MRAGRPSYTAAVMARGLFYVAGDPRMRELLPPGCIELHSKLLLETRLMEPWRVALYGKPWFRRFAEWFVRLTAPGHMMTLAVRKRFMDEEAGHAIDEGARQLLAVGAGFDTLALRIAQRFPDVQCFEIDHPATQRIKRAAIESLELECSNLHFVSVDLASTDLPDALSRAPGWRRDLSSVVAIEGVLMYLDESEVTRFLAGVRASTPPGSKLLFTHIQTDAHGRIVTAKPAPMTRAFLALVGEPLKWGIPRGALAEFLGTQGYSLEEHPTAEQQRVRYLAPAGLGEETVGDIEQMAVATVT